MGSITLLEIVEALFAMATFSRKPITGQKEQPTQPRARPPPGLGWPGATQDPAALLQACSLLEQMASGTLKLSFVYYINPYKKISFNEE